MNMKRFTFSLLFALVACSLFAQDLPQGFGFHIGFAQPVLRLNSPDTRYNNDSLVNTTVLNGLKVGFVYDATYIKGFGSSIGINYTFAQGQTNWRQNSAFATYPQTRSKTTYHQLEVFVDWQYKFEIAQSTYLILYTGPSVQCAVAMDEKVFERNWDNENNQKLSYSLFDYKDAELSRDLNRFNVTWGVGLGFQYQRYFLRGGYDFGLVNPYKNSNFNQMGFATDRRTRGRLDQWNIKIGIYLWQK